LYYYIICVVYFVTYFVTTHVKLGLHSINSAALLRIGILVYLQPRTVGATPHFFIPSDLWLWRLANVVR